MSSTTSTPHFPLRRWVGSCVDHWNRIGNQTQFYVTTLRSIGDVARHHKMEVVRLVAQMGLGVGALLIIGGTLVVVSLLTVTTGSMVGIELFRQLGRIGIEALVGFTSAYINTRILSPLFAGLGLATTIGAGATAQLGAMRIAEEIDALESMSVRSVAYLASTRVLAGVIVVIPLYCTATVTAFVSSRVVTIFVLQQSAGVYDHYFYTFLQPTDLLWSLLLAVVVAVAVMLVHTYYGYTASGGPAGVGEAVGRAVRTSLVVVVVVTLLASMAIYGQTGQFHLSM
ncbi:ABC transporter permease [Mycobacterium vicinigordonae]|uniref:ABC transporter permease n=1 Tax=Mycobacterium vicinigordonae TaxID=1719132 RepID=A0A7D6I5H2_9MYCO|nr:ABC transporter permease [Mycobacterium vicinigordonae]QLL06256.1 ABC transporter permease [Mycobacterium vicinigordonae]